MSGWAMTNELTNNLAWCLLLVSDVSHCGDLRALNRWSLACCVRIGNTS
jgi:hypothetical protein